jgi:hypothetical protein
MFGAKADTDLPPTPDFASLIPRTCAYLPASDRHGSEQEAAALAKYLTRAWSRAKSLDEFTECALNLLTVAQQLDVALMTLNPNPTVTEAVARVRVYYPIIAAVERRLKLAKTGSDEWHLTDQQEFQFKAQLFRLRRQIDEQYRPLFARAV